MLKMTAVPALAVCVALLHVPLVTVATTD